ncbi:MAG TPA: 4-alpha-glucanotransferase, partial [Stellaceae bacterium]|nr:4-alpha-glucanotransferase [Stellaceae bacterium]
SETGTVGGGIPEATQAIDGTLRARHAIALPPLTEGRHRLVLPEASAEMAVIAVPHQCFLPPVIGAGGRVWGVSVQLYAIRSRRNWGIGDYGDLAALVTLAGQAGADLVGVSPLHARSLSRPEDCSPYSPVSRLAFDTLAIDVQAVPELAGAADVRETIAGTAFQDELARLRALEWVDYAAVTAAKAPILRRLHEVFRTGAAASRREAYEEFLARAGDGVRHYAGFEALRAFHGAGLAWWDWPATPAVDDPVLAPETDFQLWLQFVADEQLAHAAAAAKQAGMRIGIYGDLAVAAAADGADNWSSRGLMARLEVGAPPDPMSRAGQNWHMPVPDPRAMERAAFAPFAEMLRANMRHAGALRVDHAMALARLFVIPPGRTGEAGTYLAYPFEALAGVLALESRRGGCLVIGEDLGTVPDGFRDAMAGRDVLSYKVLPFERFGDGTYRTPTDYPRLSLAMASTHDLPPLSGTWLGTEIVIQARLGLVADEAEARRQRAAERQRLLDLFDRQGVTPDPRPDPGGRSEDAAGVVAAAHRLIAGSGAAIAMIQLADILGETRPVNIPGTSTEYPNWRLKLPIAIEDAGFATAFADAAQIMAAARPR